MLAVVFDLADDAVLDVDDLVGAVGNAALMRDHDDGHALFAVELGEQLHHFLGSLGIERARRLVRQEDLGIGDQGAGDGHALLLSAGHLVGIVLRPGGEAELVEILHRQFVALVAAHTLVEERKFDVLHRGLESDQVEGLEDEADHPVAVVRGLALRQALDQFAVDVVFAGIIVVQDAQNVEQRRFAGARGSHDGNELAAVDREVDSLQHMQRLSVVVSLVDVFEFDEHIVSY